MTKLHSFLNSLKELMVNYPDIGITLIVKDNEEQYIVGNSCPSCALDALEEFIEDNHLSHFESEEETKH